MQTNREAFKGPETTQDAPSFMGEDRGINVTEYDEHYLTCPNCGHDYMHQLAAEIHAREEDGKAKVIRVDLKTGDITHDAHHENPSNRRQGLIVEFACENCDFTGTISYLGIWQHKGNTVIEWT